MNHSSDKSAGPKDNGREAMWPSQIPLRGWWQVAKRVKDQVISDHVPIVSAGVAFFFFLALFPGIAATISIYGLVVDPAEAASQVDYLAGLLPNEAHNLIAEFVDKLTRSSSQTLGWGVVLSLMFSFWSTNKGAKAIMNGVNIAYNETDQRNFIVKNVLTLIFTIGMILIVTVGLAVVAGIPAITNLLGLTYDMKPLVTLARWPVVAVAMMLTLGCIYKFAPHRKGPKPRWVSWGAVIATLLWLAGSGLFSLYVDHFGNFAKNYGSMAAVVVLMLWFYLTAYIILLGAEVNAELEHQTAKDSTEGPPNPMGSRGAFVADHVAEEAEG